MATGVRSGKLTTAVGPDDGSQGIITASPTEHQQLAIRPCSPERESDRRSTIQFEVTMIAYKDESYAKSDTQASSSPTAILDPTFDRIFTASPAPPPAPPAPQPSMSWRSYKDLLQVEDVEFLDPDFQTLEQEHGKTILG